MTFSLDAANGGRMRVVVADDSVLLREGLVRLLDELGAEVVGSYGDADSLLAEVEAVRPDLAVLDVRMPPTHRDEECARRSSCGVGCREPGSCCSPSTSRSPTRASCSAPDPTASDTC
ncbi:hypothetical protein GCM10025867_22250 [Frondihabitans sucicola]|uniref:Response regulatory domain-containing protein n=1 Tax=Frondihabitans sucicola TaxID=1268041 RepID=A0ABN6XYD0_9MICO|nr:hypothetical protein GCM10025867_22250 [Frondihabitans sucicola]